MKKDILNLEKIKKILFGLFLLMLIGLSTCTKVDDSFIEHKKKTGCVPLVENNQAYGVYVNGDDTLKIGMFHVSTLLKKGNLIKNDTAYSNTEKNSQNVEEFFLLNDTVYHFEIKNGEITLFDKNVVKNQTYEFKNCISIDTTFKIHRNNNITNSKYRNLKLDDKIYIFKGYETLFLYEKKIN